VPRSWIFIFWSWKSHGKSMLKKRGHPAFGNRATKTNAHFCFFMMTINCGTEKENGRCWFTVMLVYVP